MEQVITVSQVNKYLKLKMDHDVRLSDIYISGEISNFTNHSKSGHFYFSLKDESSAIKAVMFRQHSCNVKFTPKDGQKVIVRGQVSVFERDGIYQVYVTEIVPDGAGTLALAFEELKEKLKNEGLFDEKHKKSLPLYPEKIGIVTSPTGAAVQDMLNVFKRRYPLCELVIYPALVQGDNAAKTITDGIKYFYLKNMVDVIIIARGGGSAEDLWCFNDEALAREIYASHIPVVSAVGHETDFTIADFVSDLRAPTPSAAAELCTPDINSLRYNLSEFSDRSEALIKSRLEMFSKQLEYFENRPCLKNAEYYLKSMKDKLLSLMSRPCISRTDTLFDNQKTKLIQLNDKLNSATEKIYFENKAKLLSLAAKLDALSPLKVLTRGYSFVTKQDKLVSCKSLSPDDEVSVRFYDGTAQAKILTKTERGNYNVK